MTPVDFMSVGCAAAATTKNVAVKNTGTGMLTFTTSVAGSGSFTATPASGSVGAGATVNVVVSASVPGTATAGVDQTATLTITTNDSAHGKFDVPLKLKTSGVTLTLLPTVASFGVLPVGTQAPDLPLTLTNTGNLAATITFTQPTDSQFGVTYMGSPAAASVAPAATLTMLAARFKPSKITPSTGSAAIMIAEPVCGAASVATIPMTGQGTNGVVGFSSTDVFFGANGRVDCGTTATAKTFTIVNGGNSAFAWTGTLAKGAASPFSFAPQSGTVPANNGMVTITVTPTAGIPAAASTANDAFGDTLSIVTDVANDTSHPITLHQTANGAVLTFVPGSVDFGLVPINNTANAPFSVFNDGNALATVTLASDNASFSLSPLGPTGIAGGLSGPVTATFSPGVSVLPQTANVTAAVDSATVLCAPLPSALTMAGTGTNGSVSYSPVGLDFGNVNCGTTAAAKSVTFTNNGNQNYTISAALGKGSGSSFTISMFPDSGVVAQDGGTVVITATPSGIPQTSAVTPNLYGDTLTVTSDVPNDTPHDIALRETAKGSIFAISTNSLNFGSVAVGANATSGFTVTNNGNAAGTLSFTSGQPTIFSLPIGAVMPPNTSSAQNGNFTPLAAQGYSDTAIISVTAASGTVLCAALPFTSMSLLGTGSASNVVAVSQTSLSFGSGGFVPCGTTAAAQMVSVTNNSSQALTLALTLMGGTSSPFTVTGPSSVGVGATVMVTVTPKAIPATSTTANDAFGDTLSIAATGGVVNETHVVALHQTAQGAVLTLNPASLSYTATGSKGFTVINAGNLAAPYTLTLAGASQFSLTPTAGTAAGGGSGSASVTYTRPLVAFPPYNGTVTLSTTAGRCAPLPAALTLSGN